MTQFLLRKHLYSATVTKCITSYAKSDRPWCRFDFWLRLQPNRKFVTTLFRNRDEKKRKQFPLAFLTHNLHVAPQVKLKHAQGLQLLLGQNCFCLWLISWLEVKKLLLSVEVLRVPAWYTLSPGSVSSSSIWKGNTRCEGSDRPMEGPYLTGPVLHF